MQANVKVLKQQLIQNSQSGLALDIDETLSWTVGYWMEQLSIRFGNIENVPIKELAKKYRYAQNVPQWQTVEATAVMEELRHADHLQEHISLIENADKMVQKIRTIVPIVAYITTRPDNIITGTKKWLSKHNFPVAEVIARPLSVPAQDGNKWKAEVLKYLYPQVIGIIDDNPGLVEALDDDYQGTIYMYDNLDHPKKSKKFVPCATWDDVLRQIKAHH